MSCTVVTVQSYSAKTSLPLQFKQSLENNHHLVTNIYIQTILQSKQLQPTYASYARHVQQVFPKTKKTQAG